jgi:hypothetical protein
MIPQTIAANANIETVPKKLTIPTDSTRNPSIMDNSKTKSQQEPSPMTASHSIYTFSISSNI